MEQIVYERPREKLRTQGSEALSMVELLQLVIGPGGHGASGATLAREVHALIVKGGVTYGNLLKINGIGGAKACQILGVYELATRLGTVK